MSSGRVRAIIAITIAAMPSLGLVACSESTTFLDDPCSGALAFYIAPLPLPVLEVGESLAVTAKVNPMWGCPLNPVFRWEVEPSGLVDIEPTSDTTATVTGLTSGSGTLRAISGPGERVEASSTAVTVQASTP